MAALKAGEMAPEIELPAVTGKQRHKFKLSDFRGKANMVVAFYPLDWSPTWTNEMSAYSRYLQKFAEHDAQVVGISPDSIYSHLAWQEKSIGWLEYPLLSDYWPHAGVAQQFGILRLGEPLPGINDRAVFIVDKQGKIAFSKTYELGQEPDYEELVTELGKVK